jgi:hypothetical protein
MLSVTSNRITLVIANVSSSPILVTLRMEAVRSSETSVHTRGTQRNIPEDGIPHSHRSGNFKYYIASTALYRRRNVFPVKYELHFYIPKDGCLHSHRRENPKILHRS